MLTQVPLASVAQVRALEASAIAALGGDSFALMQRAGQAAWEFARINFPAARRWLVCCGTGNNGGDGYLVAAHAAACGVDVTVVRTGPPGTADSGRAAAQCADLGVAVMAFDGAPLPLADLVIDAVLGLGIDDAPRGVAEALIAAINSHAADVLALDLPSGIDADRGCAPGACILAARTLTFLAHKPGLCTGAGKRAAGIVKLAALGCAFVADVDAPLISLLTGTAASAMPKRAPDDHKGRRGRALLIGGDTGMGGAIALAGEACARAGAGIASVITRSMHVGSVLARRPELLVLGEEPGNGEISDAAASALSLADVVAIGPGLGRGAWGRDWMQRALAAEAPRVFDADALNLLAAQPSRLREEDIITPHPGEAARLLGCTVAEIERDRIRAARALAARFNAVCVLKGAGSLVADAAGRVAVSPHAVPALATGGTGDVLTGLIAGLRAQGLDAWTSASVGVLTHAECGLAASAKHGSRGVLAGDLAAFLPSVLND